MKQTRIACEILPFKFIGLPFLSQAESPVKAEIFDTVIAAEPIERVPPRYPKHAAMQKQEGWVQVSFVIGDDGKVLDPIVTDSSGITSLEKAALRSVEKWQYNPATRDGAAIEQCQTRVQLDFRLDNNKESGVRRKFRTKYMKISTAIAEQDFVSAELGLQEFKEDKLWNRTESALYWLLDANFANAIKDSHRELASSFRGVLSGEDALGTQNYQYLQSRLFVLQLKDNQLSAALETYKHLVESKNGAEAAKPLEAYAAKIKEVLTGEQPIARTATLLGSRNWTHKLSRDRFTMTNVNGQLDEMEIRCDNKRSRSTIANDSTWTIPKSWGQCTVFVKGAKNSSFTLVEESSQA
ncbi:MAG: energy transducer TonB [Paraglaciecola sp.]|uniref:energy transducer TonB n=1 Tax=Paraglaciecola sp. TaxID=1920173 RepID=UPI003296A4E2